MKKILFAAAAVVALASCATDEVISRPDNEVAIEFDNAFVDNSTRVATDLTLANLQDFGVYGTVAKGGSQALIFDNTKVSNNSGTFTYSPAQYWVEDANYTFSAFAPYTGAKWAYTTTNSDAHNGTLSFNNAEALGEQDLIFASTARTTGTTLTAAPAKVNFTFGHLLSKVAFKYTNSFTDGNITLNVYDVKINNAAATGTVALTNGAIGAWAGAGDYVRSFGLATAAAENLLANGGGTFTTEHFYLIPVEREYNITFKVDLIQSGVLLKTYEHTVTTTINLEKGKSYSINAALTPENVNPDPTQQLYPIEFDVIAVEDWVNAGDVALEAKTVATAAELVAAIAEGGEIRLTEDINLDAIATTRATYGLFIEKDCVIDGAGHTFTSTSGRAIAVSGANNVTLKNFTLQATGERGIQVQGNAKNVTIENVTATAANYTVSLPSSAGATVVTINNCDLKGLNTINVAAPGSKVTVNNTTLRCEDNADEGYSVVCIHKDGVGAAVTVNGGEVIITGSNPDHTCGGSVEATDATLTFNETKGNTTIRGYGFAIEYGDYYYSFPTFEAALAKAVEGETIILLHDITIESHLSINKNVNLDLNGKTITVDIKGGVGDDAIWVRDNAESVISNGAIRFINEVESTKYASGIFATGTSKVTIKDMDIVAAAEAVFAQANASVEILSGSFKSTEYPQFTLNLKDSARDTASIVVKGGKYFQFNPADNAAEGEHTNFVAAGYTVEQNGDWYIVK